MFLPVRVLGTGIYLPAKVSAADLDLRMGLAPGTSLARNGVCNRHFAGATETPLLMAAAAVRNALAVSGRSPEDLDAILFTGILPEQPMPTTATLLHKELGGRSDGVTCFDVNASCNGFLRCLETAAVYIGSGQWNTCAIVAAEAASKGLNWNDPDTATLFGDGAAAAILSRAQDEEGVLRSHTSTWSEGSDLSVIRAGGSRFNVRTPPERMEDYLFAMNGRRLLRLVQQHFPPFLDHLLAGETPEVIVPHQASAVGLAFLKKQMADRRSAIVDILRDHGNQVSASLPTAFHYAIATETLRRGQTALLVGTAAGLSISGMLLRY